MGELRRGQRPADHGLFDRFDDAPEPALGAHGLARRFQVADPEAADPARGSGDADVVVAKVAGDHLFAFELGLAPPVWAAAFADRTRKLATWGVAVPRRAGFVCHDLGGLLVPASVHKG